MRQLTRLRCLLCASLLGLAGCSTVADLQPHEVLSETTGSTLIVVAQPLVFARMHEHAPQNERDYVRLVAVQEDVGGSYRTWLLSYQYTNVEPQYGGAAPVIGGHLHIVADGRDTVLTPDPANVLPGDRGMELFKPDWPARVENYSLDADTLQSLANAHTVTVRFEEDPMPENYILWEDGRAALSAWVAACANRK